MDWNSEKTVEITIDEFIEDYKLFKEELDLCENDGNITFMEATEKRKELISLMTKRKYVMNKLISSFFIPLKYQVNNEVEDNTFDFNNLGADDIEHIVGLYFLTTPDTTYLFKLIINRTEEGTPTVVHIGFMQKLKTREAIEELIERTPPMSMPYVEHIWRTAISYDFDGWVNDYASVSNRDINNQFIEKEEEKGDINNMKNLTEMFRGAGQTKKGVFGISMLNGQVAVCLTKEKAVQFNQETKEILDVTGAVFELPIPAMIFPVKSSEIALGDVILDNYDRVALVTGLNPLQILSYTGEITTLPTVASAFMGESFVMKLMSPMGNMINLGGDMMSNPMMMMAMMGENGGDSDMFTNMMMMQAMSGGMFAPKTTEPVKQSAETDLDKKIGEAVAKALAKYNK